MKISFILSKLMPIALIGILAMTIFFMILFFVAKAHSSTDMVSRNETVSHTPTNPEGIKWGFFSAALATGFSTIGAAIAVGLVGSAAMGTMSEKPEMAGRALIFVGLAEGIAIYGLIVAIMILGKI